MRKQGTEAQPVILGYDAAGVVEARRPELPAVPAGERVYYAGNVNRPGTNAPFHLVDERIVGRMPEIAELRRGRGAAADHDHGLGAAVRPDRREARRGGRSPLPAHRRRRGRRRLDRHSARAQAHRSLRHRHRLAPGNADLGAQPRCAPCHRPQQAVRSAAESGGLPWRRHRAGAHRNRTQRRPDLGGHIASGPSRADRGRGFAQGFRHGAAVVEMREHPSRIDVHPLDVRHSRHDRAASPAERGRRARRPGCAAHDA